MSQTQQLIEAVEKADSSDRLLKAVENLAAAKDKAAIPTLVEVLGFNNPGAAVAAVEGLIDIGEPSIPYLLDNLDGYNYGARAWAVRVFAGVGDPRALDLLLDAAGTDFSLSVRRAAARGLGFIRWSKLPPPERLAAQQKALQTLILASRDGEWVVRYAAVVGLQALGEAVSVTESDLSAQIRDRFTEILAEDRENTIKARAKLALQQHKSEKREDT